VTEEEPQFDELPAPIVARLRAADRAEPIVDLATDRAVLHSAERYFHFRRAPRTAARIKRLVPMAAAAVVLLALLIVQPVERLRHPDDVDGSGRVDILDAFALARMPDGDEASAALAARVVALRPRRAP
jgi:hypothetical protein